MSTWAVIVAAGSGDRLAADRPKAFARLGDRPLLAESLERLDRSEWVDGIVVACPEGWEEPAILLAEELGASKVAQAVTGGASRAESVRLGVNEVPPDAVALLVHDAARPLLAEDVISRVLEPLGEGWDGAVPALPVADTIKRVEGRQGRRDARARRSHGGADPAGLRGRRAARRARGRRRRRIRLRLARRGSRRPGEGRRRRSSAAEGDDRSRTSASSRRSSPRRRRDRRLPHASPRRSRGDRVRSAGRRPVRRDGDRAGRRGDRLHGARLLLPADRGDLGRAVPVGAVRPRPRRVLRRRPRGEARGIAREARARGGLRRRAPGLGSQSCSSRTRSTSGSDRCTGSTVWRSTCRRGPGR